MPKKAYVAVSKVLSGKKLRPSDLTFTWRVNRYHDQDWHAIENEMVKCGLDKKLFCTLSPAEEEKSKKQMQKIFAKHTKKWYTYSLFRFSEQVDTITNELAKVVDSAYKKIKENDGFKSLQAICTSEAKKTRRFSSLAAMQRYVDKNGLGVDVYKLWENEKKLIKRNASNGN